MSTSAKFGLALYAALFDDIAVWDARLQLSLEGDLYFLEELTNSLGYSFIMIDMPEAGKVLDKALSTKHFDPLLLPETFGVGTNGDADYFLQCLFHRVFCSETGSLHADVDTNAVRFLRRVLYLAKKVRKDCSDAAIQAEVTAFQAIDSALRHPSLNWVGDELGFDPTRVLSLLDGLGTPDEPELFEFRYPSASFLRRIEQVSDNLVSRFKSLFDWRDLEPKHGPGSVADARSGEDKYSFPTWPSKLERVFPFSYFGWSSEDLAYRGLEHPSPSPKEFPARLLAVPKTLKGPRMIASEPISHQFIQLGLMRWIRDNLPEPLNRCLNFKDQRPSRVMCLEASVTGRNATVDLSAASDRLSCWLVERIFRRAPAFLEALHASRTRTLVNATGIGDTYSLVLRKYAPMGNGTTFPVQSIIYAIIAIASVLESRSMRVSNRNIGSICREIRVFGDDIILPSSAVGHLALALDYFQLKVNVTKTHDTGQFRESCGMDAFRGEDVTPLYLADLELRDTSLSLTSWLDVMKNAWAMNYTHYLVETMRAMIPFHVWELIPTTDRDLGCLTQPGYPEYFPTTRVSSRFHCLEVLGLTIEAKPVVKQRENDANLVQYRTDDPSPASKWKAGFVVRNRFNLKKRWVTVS